MPDLPPTAVRLRYEAGNVWRFLSSPWLQQAVSPEDCSTLFAASFGREGWHHIRRTLQEYDRNPTVSYRDTTLYRFLTEFRPSSISDLVSAYEGPRLSLFDYPWGTFRVGGPAPAKDPWTSRFCGPSTDEFVRDEFDRTISLYQEIKKTGYRPYQYPHSFVGGTWIEAKDRRRRFVVLQGNHRMAMLAHLGFESVAVRSLSGWLARVREADVDDWPLVRSGRCSKKHALAIFALFFDMDGHHISVDRLSVK